MNSCYFSLCLPQTFQYCILRASSKVHENSIAICLFKRRSHSIKNSKAAFKYEQDTLPILVETTVWKQLLKKRNSNAVLARLENIL